MHLPTMAVFRKLKLLNRYEECLRVYGMDFRPFGDDPEVIGGKIGHVLVAYRLASLSLQVSTDYLK